MSKDEIVKQRLEIYSEGNKYLYDALCSCYEHGIETYACCAGHNATKLPYFALIIKKDNLKYIRNIIANLQDMKDIRMEYTVIFDKNNKPVKRESGRGFIIRGELNNRCEMFYRINEGIIHQQQYPKTSMNAEMFYRRLEDFYEMDEEEIIDIVEDERVLGGVYSNNSDELMEYKKLVNKLINNPIVTKVAQSITKKGKKEKERFLKLDKIYGTLQNEYVPSIKETLKESIVSEKEENDKNDNVEEFEYEDAEYYELNRKITDENEK